MKEMSDAYRIVVGNVKGESFHGLGIGGMIVLK
jgi:hypothetical protein